MKFWRSLQFKYMLIILMALFLIQAIYLGVGIFFVIVQSLDKTSLPQDQISAAAIEEQWHEQAGELQAASPDGIRRHFAAWKEDYKEAAMFWVDAQGVLAEQLDADPSLPHQWTPSFTAQFIKERYGGDPFTVIAFVGEQQTDGFVVLELPRSVLAPVLVPVYERYGAVLMGSVLLVLLLFLLISFMFFRGIRKRLLLLQDAMKMRDANQLPIQIHADKIDEIGQLEHTFNEMVFELRESKEREQQEEQLRRELIANLSHDLRTPLTKLRANTYSLTKEQLTPEGSQAVQAIEASIVSIDRLMENLMAYTLLMASKLNYEPEQTDVLRLVREVVASWYPVLEKEGFEIVVDLHPLNQPMWEIDKQWMERILDNLIQNVLRHAHSGLFLQVTTEMHDGYDAVIIKDKGQGADLDSSEKGAGIGLSIVDKMVKTMNLEWVMLPSKQGTTVKLIKTKQGGVRY
ncbi:sensor histidine kinase [Paenibacillus senegalensis]|uniref:sensor histidine kinase n=1 Tax=Paenibacillus senegalensis TaxID=1465766 RepID=UPI000288094A|nr:HAMP domain-containing sensor histidine kinase [Paenibacillus senegalensis]